MGQPWTLWCVILSHISLKINSFCIFILLKGYAKAKYRRYNRDNVEILAHLGVCYG